MLELSLEHESHIIDDREIMREGTSYTYDTIRSIKDTHKKNGLAKIANLTS